MPIREQRKKLSGLEMELAAARQEGFVSKHLSETNRTPKRRPLVVVGVYTGFGRKSNRDAIRKAWMGTGATLKKMEEENGIIIRFVIGRSSNRGDSMDRSIDGENKQTDDIFILENHVEAPEELPNKTKLFFAHAAEKWDADYYAKVNDDVYLNVDALTNVLTAHLDKPRVYIGCMKSGEVFSERGQKWYEPDWWKFGMGKREMFVISQALAKFISINNLYFVFMPMTMSLLVPGLLGWMSSMLMRRSCAAQPGPQELYVQAYNLIEDSKNSTKQSALLLFFYYSNTDKSIAHRTRLFEEAFFFPSSAKLFFHTTTPEIQNHMCRQ
ncbi:UNVERIFIED_CONTAM: Hydroxyproline O-galactosyltransferase HPGT1 [Sesamum radiatum]|uniref:Hexosyltransferase n=1 Tax=Sesamum radiatum TaxID=300843 RepID=A0AAW2KDW6_SESRA